MREFDLNIEKVLENWSVAHALREIIANALDEQVLTGTQAISIYKKELTWHIRDFGRGLKYIHLTQNENDEKLTHPQLIGKFGVGLKDALATFDRHGIKVRIESRYGQITLGKSQKHGFDDIVTLHAYIDEYISKDFVGTDFCITGCSDSDIEQAKDYFLKFSDMKLMETTEYGDIYQKRNSKSEIFINGIKVAEEENFLFSYNITSLNAALKKALNRERTNVGRSAYSDRVRAILLNAESEGVVTAFTDNLTKMSKGEQCDEMKWIDVQTHAVKILNSRKETVFVTPEEIQKSAGNILEVVRESGRTPVFVPETVKRKIEGETDITGKPISTITTVVQEYNNSFEYKFIEYENLTYSEQCIYDLIPSVIALLNSKFDPARIFISEKLKTDFTMDALGLFERDENRIIILRTQLASREAFLGTLIHELTHADTGMPDVSRGFESELTHIIGNLADKVLLREDDGKQEDKASLDQIKAFCKGDLSKSAIRVLEKHGKIAFENDYAKEAILIYSELLRRKEKPDYYYFRANQYAVKEYWDKAYTDINKALKLQPTEASYMVQKAKILIGKKKTEKAYKILNEAYKIDTSNEELLYVSAQTYLDQKDYKKAMIWLNRILAMNPDDVSSVVAIIAIESDVYGDIDRAIKLLEKALRKCDSSARLYFVKACLMSKKKQWKTAYEAIEKALELDPTESKYHQLYGSLKTLCDGNMNFSL